MQSCQTCNYRHSYTNKPSFLEMPERSVTIKDFRLFILNLAEPLKAITVNNNPLRKKIKLK